MAFVYDVVWKGKHPDMMMITGSHNPIYSGLPMNSGSGSLCVVVGFLCANEAWTLCTCFKGNARTVDEQQNQLTTVDQDDDDVPKNPLHSGIE